MALRYDFNNPPPECSVAYFWIINDKVDAKVCKAQLEDMAAHGLQAVCFHPEPPEFRPVAMATRLDLPYDQEMRSPRHALLAL